MAWVISFMLPYLLGSFSSAYFLGQLILEKDMSQEGSGNLGAKNTFLVGGPRLGIGVFLCDLAKGAISLLLIKWFFGSMLLMYWAAVAVVLGHNFSIYINFRGGKGLATLAGILLVLNFKVLLIVGALAGIFALLSRDAGVAAILAAIPFALIFSVVANDWRSLPFMLILTMVVLVKHRPQEFQNTAAFLRLRRV